jgi:hypothetical protein
LLVFPLRAENGRQDGGKQDEVIVAAEKVDAATEKRTRRTPRAWEVVWREKGDMWSEYRYYEPQSRM